VPETTLVTGPPSSPIASVIPYPPLRWSVALSAYLGLGLSAGLVPPSAGRTFSLPDSLAYGLVMSGALILLHGLLWTYLGSMLLGSTLGPATTLQFVGHCYLKPALLAIGVTAFAWATYLSASGGSVESVVRGGRLIAVIWALASVVRVTSSLNHFTKLKTALFVAWWFAVLVGGLFIWRLVRA
jgi:hypothetical protein